MLQHKKLLPNFSCFTFALNIVFLDKELIQFKFFGYIKGETGNKSNIFYIRSFNASLTSRDK